MSRHHSSGSYGHGIERLRGFGEGYYRLSWAVDRYYASSRLRHPTEYRRDTDEDGARRFAKRWDLTMPEAQEAAAGRTEGDRHEQG